MKKKIVVNVVTLDGDIYTNTYIVQSLEELIQDVTRLARRDAVDAKGFIFVNGQGKVLEVGHPVLSEVRIDSICKVMTGYYD